MPSFLSLKPATATTSAAPSAINAGAPYQRAEQRLRLRRQREGALLRSATVAVGSPHAEYRGATNSPNDH